MQLLAYATCKQEYERDSKDAPTPNSIQREKHCFLGFLWRKIKTSFEEKQKLLCAVIVHFKRTPEDRKNIQKRDSTSLVWGAVPSTTKLRKYVSSFYKREKQSKVALSCISLRIERQNQRSSTHWRTLEENSLCIHRREPCSKK